MKQSLSYAEKEREIDLKEREAIVYRAESLQREFEHVNKLLQVCLLLLFHQIEHSNVPKFFKIFQCILKCVYSFIFGTYEVKALLGNTVSNRPDRNG